ncbi:hypothetical protein EYF80_056889 [Liparis tanakae]|uniref:Uncharacterized protein n=1 Tax=Liparis tanakae TaxID=230148 RepID=A0A4Z2EVW6_9TELE|nr:hypothetical protein EYF80_056889 [Liparis tanakae]
MPDSGISPPTQGPPAVSGHRPAAGRVTRPMELHRGAGRVRWKRPDEEEPEKRESRRLKARRHLLGYVLVGYVLVGYVLVGYVLVGYVLVGYVLVDVSSPGALRVAFKPDRRRLPAAAILVSKPVDRLQLHPHLHPPSTPPQVCSAMDTESTYSGYSYYSGRSRGSHRHG